MRCICSRSTHADCAGDATGDAKFETIAEYHSPAPDLQSRKTGELGAVPRGHFGSVSLGVAPNAWVHQFLT